MNSVKYAKAMKEVTEYLKGITKEDFDKIPADVITFLYENQDKDYACNIDYTIPFKDMELTDEAKGIIVYLCYNYWCGNEKEKQNLINKLNENEQNFQEELKKQFKGTDILNQTKKEKLPIKCEENEKTKNKISIVTKILDFIKKLTKKN